MQHVADIDQIIRRAAAIGLSPRRLATLAHVHHSTIWHLSRGRDSKGSTVKAVINAVERAERSMLVDLVRLHPDLARDVLAGRVAEADPRQVDIEDALTRSSSEAVAQTKMPTDGGRAA